MTLISDDKIQDYIDGRLDKQDEAAIAAYLLANPDKAREIQSLRHQNEALRAIGHEVLLEPIPNRLKDVIHLAEDTAQFELHDRSHSRGFRDGLVLASLLAAGVAFGWIARGWSIPPYPTPTDLAMQSARDAYLFYGRDKDFPVEFNADRDSDLTAWLKSAFNSAVGRPNLDELGYRYIGARVLPSTQGRMGLYLYENPKGARAALMFWPSKKTDNHNAATPNYDDISTAIYPGSGIRYALLCDKKNGDFQKISDSVMKYFSASQ